MHSEEVILNNHKYLILLKEFLKYTFSSFDSNGPYDVDIAHVYLIQHLSSIKKLKIDINLKKLKGTDLKNMLSVVIKLIMSTTFNMLYPKNNTWTKFLMETKKSYPLNIFSAGTQNKLFEQVV